jgi:hypothetical protein
MAKIIKESRRSQIRRLIVAMRLARKDIIDLTISGDKPFRLRYSRELYATYEKELKSQYRARHDPKGPATTLRMKL